MLENAWTGGAGTSPGFGHFAIQKSAFEGTVATANGIYAWTEPMLLRPGVQIVFISEPDYIKIELMSMRSSEGCWGEARNDSAQR